MLVYDAHDVVRDFADAAQRHLSLERGREGISISIAGERASDGGGSVRHHGRGGERAVYVSLLVCREGLRALHGAARWHSGMEVARGGMAEGDALRHPSDDGDLYDRDGGFLSTWRGDFEQAGVGSKIDHVFLGRC